MFAIIAHKSAFKPSPLDASNAESLALPISLRHAGSIARDLGEGHFASL